ncbi:DsrE family protein [Hydrogenophaga sp. 5NK40-0174]|uniref:DsrE family protein n=1 Tax=Hydrogenophaga sp. 5NK40-0174 TaxID=3127649 RepID=UPI003108FA26
MKRVTNFLKLVAAGLVLASSSMAQAADGAVKAVYHFADGVAQASQGLRNINNHLNADPTVKIVVVAHGKGIDFLLEGAKTPEGSPFSGSIGDLAARGVEFRVCNNTLVARKIDPARVALEAKVVPSGVAEVANLQAKEGFAYVRP